MTLIRRSALAVTPTCRSTATSSSSTTKTIRPSWIRYGASRDLADGSSSARPFQLHLCELRREPGTCGREHLHALHEGFAVTVGAAYLPSQQSHLRGLPAVLYADLRPPEKVRSGQLHLRSGDRKRTLPLQCRLPTTRVRFSPAYRL